MIAFQGMIEGRKVNSKVFLGEMYIYGTIQQRNEDKRILWMIGISISIYL